MTPILQETIEWRLYPMHAGFCVLSFILVFFAYPESASQLAYLCLVPPSPASYRRRR